MPRLLARVLLALGAVLLAGLVFEGSHSLLTGRPLLGGNSFLAPSVGRLRLTDAERAAVAVSGAGPFSLSCDPGVAFTMRPDSTYTLGVPVRIDRYGTRVRLGPEPAPGTKRVVLLGDSVTFGFGVADDETMAHRLERHLAGVTPAGTAAPAVFTLACPGWNVWNCARALCDHLGRLEPDIVVYTPVANDLYDSFATTESGHRAFAFDPAVGMQRPHVNFEAHVALLAAQAPLLSPVDAVALRLAGGWDAIPPVSFSGLTPESRRRWQGFCDVIADLDQRLRRRNGAFAVQLCFDDTFELLVASVLGERAPDVPLVPPFSSHSATDRLQGDPHPNALCIDARARVLAAFLLQRGLVAGDVDALPPLAPAYRDRVAALGPASDRAAWRREHERGWRQRIGPTIDLTCARGAHQVYGGVEADGMVGRGAWMALDARGAGDGAASSDLELTLEVERLPLTSGLYPCNLAIRFGGRPAHVYALSEPDDATGPPWTLRVPAPPGSAREPEEEATGCIDVLIEPTNYIVQDHEGRSRLACFRLRRASLGPAAK